uniref:Uncharacterized protein n=1 Tax=Roseihalotalea indica TaxID=2867963 RepID=A0AA49JB29_9BACT|nr:hypothetical protein K4G66_17585 [Tunicatimonas sp. TK19036]
MANSIGEVLQWAHTLVHNAKNHSGIQVQLDTLGFKPEHITTGETLLLKTQNLEQEQRSYYEKKLAATDALADHLAELRTQYREHATLAKLAFADQRPLRKSLGLDRYQPRRRSEWIKMVTGFYQELVRNPKPMAKYGVPKAKLEQMLASAQSAMVLLIEQQQAKGDAQRATQHKQQSLQELKQWCRNFQRIAEVALQDDPQLLEVLGKTVPSGR